MKTMPLLAAVLISAGSLAVHAEETALDVEKAVRLAVANNLELKSARITLASAGRAKKYSWNAWLPSIDVSTGVTRLNQAGAMSGVTYSPWYLGFLLEASLPLSLAKLESIRATALSYESGRIDYETAKRKLERDVRKTFYALLVSQESIRLAEQELATAERQYQQTQKNYQAGLVPRLDMLSARVSAENLKPALEERKVSYTTSLMDFRLLLGLESEEPLKLEGSITATAYHFDPVSLTAHYLGGRLDLRSLAKRVEILENQKSQKKLSNLSPTVSVAASLQPTGNDPFGSLWTEGSLWSDEGYLTLGVSIPLDGFLPGSSTRVALAESQDAIEKARLALEQARWQAATEIKSYVLALDKSLRSLEALELNVTLAQEAYNLSEAAYAAGTLELLEVQNASDNLQKAGLSLLQERYNYLSSLIDLAYSLNTTLGDLEEKHVP